MSDTRTLHSNFNIPSKVLRSLVESPDEMTVDKPGGRSSFMSSCRRHWSLWATQDPLYLLLVQDVGFLFSEMNSPRSCVVLVRMSIRTPHLLRDRHVAHAKPSTLFFRGSESWIQRPTGNHPLQEQRTSKTISSIHLDP